MLYEQKLQSLHCTDLRVENTKLSRPTVISILPATAWLFKYSVSKPPKVSRILSLLVPFVKKFWNHTVKVNVVSLLDISFHLFLTQTAAILRVASEDMKYKTAQGGRWIASKITFSADIHQIYGKKSRLAAVSSRNRYETYVFKLHIFNLDNETRRMRHSSAPRADIPRIFALCLSSFFSWFVKAQVTFKKRLQGK